jgi:glutathione peroxidase
LNVLQDQFRDDFVILGFPCNQFGGQEPGANGTEIANSIRFVRPGKGYFPNFPLFAKLDVNGEKAHPLYVYLRSQCPSPVEAFREKKRLLYDPLNSNDIRWNFEKFIIDRNGKPYLRFHPTTRPSELVPYIKEVLRKDQSQFGTSFGSSSFADSFAPGKSRRTSLRQF